MAIIYSNRNDNTGSHTTANSLSTSTWAGGVVPGAVDQVYVVGRRTQINQAAFAKWVSTITITVDSTSNFASSGFFYVNTNGGEIVKVNYTGTTATTFTGCTVDESDSFYLWDSGQTIPDNAYVHNPAFIIEINAGQTFECNELILQEGGWIQINGGTLKINQGILVRDGRLIGRGSGVIEISRPSTSLTSLGYLTGENFPLSIIDLEGDELRTYATLQANTDKGAHSITVNTPTNGTFAVGDEIAIFQTNEYRYRNKGYTGYRDASMNLRDLDEGFDVAGVSGNTIFLAERNGAKGIIKSVATVSSQKVVEVLPESTYFNAGDKIVINNVAYTVDAIEDSEFLLYDYDFTNPSTSLSDFWVNDSTHIYSEGWEIESGVGLRNTTAGYEELIHKFFWNREVILEAEMSPLSGYDTGTRGTAAFGLCAAYDPSYRRGHRAYDTFKTDYFVIDDTNNQDLYYAIRSMSNYQNNRPDRVTRVRDLIQGPVSYKVVNRKGRTYVTMNGEELTTEHRRDGHFKGLVGLYTNGNTNFRCRSFKIKQATQKLYLTTTDSFSVDATVWTTGADHAHLAGSRVLKIASVNTGEGNHKDLGFSYRGQYGNGEWPVMTQINGITTTNSSLPFTHNHDATFDYYLDLGTSTAARSITLDLTAQKTFTHVSFLPRMHDINANWSNMTGVAIYGSNDLTNWTTLYGPTNDSKFWYRFNYNRIAYYPTGTVSFRYVKFETKGSNVSSFNRYVNIGVHDFSDGYTIAVNNASDFNIGDTVSVMSDSGWSFSSREIDGYWATTSNSADPETFYHGGWLMECTVTNKVGNKLYLDRPVWWGYVEGEDSVTVVKTNRSFTVRGTIAATGTTNDWRWPNIFMNDGGNLCRKYLFKGVRFQYVGSYRYSGSSTANRGIITAADDFWNHMLLDGCSYPMGNGDNTWGNVGLNNGAGLIVRNSFIAGAYSGVMAFVIPSFTGIGIFNNKFMGTYLGFYAASTLRGFSVNYNEIATCDVGIFISSIRTDRGIIASPREMKYNYIKGTSQAGFNVSDETVGPRRIPRINIKNNKVRATDDYSVIGRFFSGNPMIGSNFMAEHTGSRMSRYRNAGHISEGDTSSDLTWTNPQHNFGRFGYDITKGVYYIAERDYTRPDVTRIYSIQGDDFFWALGIELDVLENDVPFEVFVRFDYKMPLMANLQDDGIDDGRLRVYGLQSGEIKGALQYGAVPAAAGTEWNTFEGTFNSFSAVEGHAGVFLNRSAQNGYIDYRNAYAEVRTDYPDKIRVVGNTFNLDRIWEQYGEKRDIKLLTAPTKAININRIKF